MRAGWIHGWGWDPGMFSILERDLIMTAPAGAVPTVHPNEQCS
jgi:hypothetical protein